MGWKRGVGMTAVAVALIGGVGAAGFLGVRGLIEAMPSFEPLPRHTFEPEPVATWAPPAEARSTSEGSVDPGWLAETAARTGIPERALAAYAAADRYARAELGCAVGWNTLAGIGWVESHHGTLQGGAIDADGVARPSIIGIPLDGENETMAIGDTDGGEFDGDAEWDRAVGPMQFIPETWWRWAIDADGDGASTPHSVDDAAMTAARYLCRFDEPIDDDGGWILAVRSYNDTLDYQQRVATAAVRYAAAG